MTITAPAGITDNDELVIMVCTDGNPNTFVPPTGFTPFLGINGIKGTSNRCTLYVATKRASGEAGDYTITWTGNEQAYGFMLRVSGFSTLQSPEDLGQNAGQTASVITIDPNLPALADTLVLCFFACDDDDITVDGGFDADYVGITSDKSSTGANTCAGAIQRKDEPTPTNPPVCDWTLTASEEGAAAAMGLTATDPPVETKTQGFAEVIA